MKNRRNYYRILQVQPDAPLEIICASYRTLMRVLKAHPDLGGSTLQASLLNEAYETLSNPARRAAYDEKVLALCIKRGTSSTRHESSSIPSSLCPFCRMRLVRQPQAGETCPACGIPLPSSPKTDSSPTSRRSIERLKRNDRIFYTCSWPDDLKEARMIDLSPKGMRFVCAEKLKPGVVLKITSSGLRACGIVINLREEKGNSKPSYAIGVSFVSAQFEEARGFFISLSA